jgi:putative DNA-invertase from lambdoid prophage Rac
VDFNMEKDKRKKAAVYCRVSKADNSQTTENQRADLIRYCEAMNYEYEVFKEEESSRKTRPIKNKVFQDTLEKKYDVVLVWKLDRWARSLKELVNDLDIFKENGTEFLSLKDNIKLDDNPTNKLMIQVLGAFAEFERNIIRDRTISALKRIDEKIKKDGFYESRAGNRIAQRGRPAGSKDKKRRRRGGYFLRYTKKKVAV